MTHVRSAYPLRHRAIKLFLFSLVVMSLPVLSISFPKMATAQTYNAPTDEMYAEIVETIIMKKWQSPQKAEGKKLSCKVDIIISPEGQLQKWRIIKASGMKIFDKSVTDAIASVADLPAPPPTANPCEMVLVFTSK